MPIANHHQLETSLSAGSDLTAISRQVTEALGVPRVYIKLLVELEDFLNKSLADKVASER